MSIIEKIVKQLREADAAYYKDGTSTLTDKEYDRLKDLLRNLDSSNPYLQEIAHEGSSVVIEWEKTKHKYPLGSLNKCNEYHEFKEWWNGEPCLLQEKLDGISIALTYRQGILHTAVTRGDGETGDNILPNVMKMKGVPKFLKDASSDIVIRAEILLKHSDWLKMPEDARGKNPRNTAAGAAKELNGSKCKYLSVVAYSILNSESKDELEDINKLQNLGFDVVPFYSVNTDEQANVMYKNYILDLRKKLDYDIDGLVIKYVKKRKDEWKYPKFQIAWKFPHQSAETIIRNIEWQVSGDRVNPVAILDPVEVAGVTVSKASLHNVEYIKNLGLCFGDKVEITRRNDVIPQIERVLVKSGCQAFPIPTNCPCCGGKLSFDKNINEEDMAWMVCTNPSCSAKLLKNVLKWLEVHDTKGVAEKTIETLFNHTIFTSLVEFIELSNPNPLKEKTILGIEGMGDSKFEILKEQIQKTLNCDLILFFAGLNAPGFGKRMWERIIKYLQIEKDTVSVNDVIDFINLPYAKGLGHIEGFAELSTKELQVFINNNQRLINKMVEIVQPRDYSKPSLTSEKLKGKSFCFTGELSMSRKDAQDSVLKNGGEVKSSVTKGLTYLVTNDPNSGSTKNKKAHQLGTQVIGEKEFLELIK
jgi:DNA ligase (NAD+)